MITSRLSRVDGPTLPIPTLTIEVTGARDIHRLAQHLQASQHVEIRTQGRRALARLTAVVGETHVRVLDEQAGRPA